MAGPILWLTGNKRKGVSIRKMDWRGRPFEQYRVSLWYKGRIVLTHEYPSKNEAMRAGQSYAKSVAKGAWDKAFSR
jgi:hypothetical protein